MPDGAGSLEHETVERQSARDAVVIALDVTYRDLTPRSFGLDSFCVHAGREHADNVGVLRHDVRLLLDRLEEGSRPSVTVIKSAQTSLPEVDQYLERTIVTTETIYTLMTQLSCNQVCIDFQWLL